MNDGAAVFRVETQDPGLISYSGGIRVKMREVGYALHYKGDRDLAVQAIMRKRAEIEDGLIGSCKSLYAGNSSIIDGPAIDPFRRTSVIGWHALYGSPEWDWFEKHFPCVKPHGYAPTTVRGCVKEAWKIIRLRIRRKPILDSDYDDWSE